MYHIPGILRFEKQLLKNLPDSKDEKALEQLLHDLTHYLTHLRQTLERKGISHQELSLKSRAAWTTLEGILKLHRGQPNRYAAIFQRVQAQVAQFPKYAHYPLIIRISASSRLSHSVRIRAKRIEYQISFVSLDFPDDYFTLLTTLLFSKLSRKPIPNNLRVKLALYEDQLRENNQRPAYRNNSGLNPRGKYYNLLEIFNELNTIYFQEALQQPHISWSRRKNRHRLGSYHADQKKLLISRILDHPHVPLFVVEGIVYHEMLHMIHPIQRHNGRRIIHGRNFKNDERKFVNHIKLERWLKQDYPEFLGNKFTHTRWRNLF